MQPWLLRLEEVYTRRFLQIKIFYLLPVCGIPIKLRNKLSSFIVSARLQFYQVTPLTEQKSRIQTSSDPDM